MSDNKDEPIFTYRHRHRVPVSGSRTACIILVLVGQPCFLFFHWIIGAVLLAVACLVDVKYRSIYTCGYCGNEVAPTCKLCPTCRADLDAEP